MNQTEQRLDGSEVEVGEPDVVDELAAGPEGNPAHPDWHGHTHSWPDEPDEAGNATCGDCGLTVPAAAIACTACRADDHDAHDHTGRCVLVALDGSRCTCEAVDDVGD